MAGESESTSPAPSRDAAAEADFEEALDRLETIVERLDREELDLDEALALFEEGVGRLRAAGVRLEEARGRVEELIEEATGELSTTALDLPDALSGGEDGDG